MLNFTLFRWLILEWWPNLYLFSVTERSWQFVICSHSMLNLSFANRSIIQVKVQTAALRAVGNIVTGTDDQTQTVLNQVRSKYLRCLSSSKDTVSILNFTTRVHWSISPAFWTTARRKSTRLIMLKSNFSQIFSYRRLCGSSPILQQATNNKFRRWLRMVWYPWSSPTCQGSYPWSFWSPALQFQSNVRGEFQTQKEAAWAISNLTISGNKTQVALLFWLRLYRVALKCQLKKSSWCNI